MKVTRHLSELTQESDSVFRLGGDEFVILLESTISVQGAEMVAEKTIEKLNQPIEANEHVCYIGVSIGIAVYLDDCDDAQTMLKYADIALYEAKRGGETVGAGSESNNGL
jgi:diguanylate cyclase (GGDEF)-like protein